MPAICGVDEHVRHRPERVILRQRLLLEDIECRTAEVPRRERLDEGIFLDNIAAGHIDQEGTAFHCRQFAPANHRLGLRRAGNDEDDEVGARQLRQQRVDPMDFIGSRIWLG